MINTRSMFRLFYLGVFGIALVGSGQAATGWLEWWWPFAFAAVFAVEVGGAVLSAHADRRRQIGERALAARLLSAAVAAGAVAVNWFGHTDVPMQAGFFAGMSAIGYCIWLIDTAARRRDALRADGKLPPTPPVYGMVRWLRHPWLTRRARHLALVDPTLRLYGSLAAATAEVRAERRRAAIAAELRTMIAAAAGPKMATVAVNTYDMDEVAQRLADSADYDGLASALAVRLTPAALTARVSEPGQVSHAGQVATSSHVELNQMNQLDRGEDSPRELSQLGQSAEVSETGQVPATVGQWPTVELSNPGQLAGAGDSAPGLTGSGQSTESITRPVGQEINSDQTAEVISSPVGEKITGDLFELAAWSERHFPLPRELANLSTATTAVTPAVGHQNGHPLVTTPVTKTVTTLTLAETPDGAQIGDQSGDSDGDHGGDQNGHQMRDEVVASGSPDTPPDGDQLGDQNGDQAGDQTITTPVAKTSAAKPARKQPTNEKKLARALARNPEASVADLARDTKIPYSTVHRLLPKIRAQMSGSEAAS